MITAFVFVHVDSARIPEVAAQIVTVEGVDEVYSVTGNIDLIVKVCVSNFEDVATVVSDRLSKVPGVLDTDTHLAFRTFNQRDLDAGFALGVST